MKKAYVFLALLFILVISLGAYSNAVIYSLDDPIYRDMDELYSLASLSRPSTNRPWSSAEAEMILSRVDRDCLSRRGMLLYDRILSSIRKSSRWNGDGFGFNAVLETAIEGYAHTNSTGFRTESDWNRGYDERRSFLRLNLDFTVNDNFYTACDLHYRHNRADREDEFTHYSTEEGGRLSRDGYVGTYHMNDSMYFVSSSRFFRENIMTNVFFDARHYSFQWPRRAVFSAGGKNWNAQISRSKLSLGNSRTGNLLVDDHTFSDHLRLSFFSPSFKYDGILLFLNSSVSPIEEMTDEARIFMIHTLHFRPMDRLSFTLSENVMYKYRVLDFYYMNPSFIYHNLNMREMFNALAYIDLNFLIAHGLEAYAQIVIDQVQAPYEDDSQSNAYGIMGGLEYRRSFRNGSMLLYAEYTMTTPMLYRRDKVDFIRATRYNAVDAQTYFVVFFDYIGFPYGGDCRILELSASYTSDDAWSAELLCRFGQKGEMNIFKSHNTEGNNDGAPNIKGATPSGDVTKYFSVISLKSRFDLGRFISWPGLMIETETDWIGRFNYTKSTGETSGFQNDLQLSVSMVLSI